MQENISQEQKIDYIYETLKKNEKKAKWALIFKWGFRLFILVYMIYFIKVGLPHLIDNLIPGIPDFGSGSGSVINIDQIKSMFPDYFSN